MTDRDKAIKILEGSYKNFVLRHKGELITVNELIALLKAQEPVEPKKNAVELAGLRTWDWACPECNCILIYRANYCSCCGRPVKWE